MKRDSSAEDDLETLDLRMLRVKHLPVYPLVSDNWLSFWQCLDPLIFVRLNFMRLLLSGLNVEEDECWTKHVLLSQANGPSTVSGRSQTDKMSLNVDSRYTRIKYVSVFRSY